MPDKFSDFKSDLNCNENLKLSISNLIYRLQSF